MRKPGRHFLQIPGPSPVPDRILRAIDSQTMDHRSPEFGELGLKALTGMKTIFGTKEDVIIYPASGTGAWEAALVNTLSPGDTVLICETGQFAWLWQALARRLGLNPEVIETDWRQAADSEAIEARLRADSTHQIKAVCVVHNETSTGCTSNIPAVRAAIDSASHPALLMVDTISSLGSVEYRHDDWGVDVTIGGSQKGLMLPPGLSFNAVSEKAKAAAQSAKLPRSYWDWSEMIASNKTGYFPYTPATNMLYGLVEALNMLHEEGLEAVYARHNRHGQATRLAVESWGLEVLSRVPEHYSPVLTAVMVPEGHSADALRRIIHTELNMSLGNGLGRLQDRVFRIGHLGDFNDLTLLGTLSGIEMGLKRANIPYNKGGAQSALEFLADTNPASVSATALVA